MDNSPKGNFMFFQKNKSNDNQLSHKFEETMYAKGEEKKNGKRGGTDSKGVTPVLKDQGVNIYINTPTSILDKNMNTVKKYDNVTGSLSASSPMGEKSSDHGQNIFVDRGLDMKKMLGMEEKETPGGMSIYTLKNYKVSGHGMSIHRESSKEPPKNTQQFKPKFNKNKKNTTKEEGNMNNMSKDIKIRKSNILELNKLLKENLRIEENLKKKKKGKGNKDDGEDDDDEDYDGGYDQDYYQMWGDNSSRYIPRDNARDKATPGEQHEHVQKDMSSQEEGSLEGKRDNGKEKKERGKRKSKEKNKDNKAKGKNEEREREKDKSISKGKMKEFDLNDQEESDKKKDPLSISNQNNVVNSNMINNVSGNPSNSPSNSMNIMMGSSLNSGPSIILNMDNKNSGKNKKARNKKGEQHQEKKNESPQNRKNEPGQGKKNDSPQNKKNDSPQNKKNEMMQNKKMDSPQNRKNDQGENKKMESPHNRKNDLGNNRKNESGQNKKNHSPHNRKNDSPHNRKNNSPHNRKNKREDFLTGMNANCLLDQGDGKMIKNELLMETGVIGKNKNMDNSINFSPHYSYYYSNNRSDIPTVNTSRRGAFNKVHLDLYCDNSGSYMMDSSDNKSFNYKKEPRNDMFKLGNNNVNSGGGHGSDSGPIGSTGNLGNHGGLSLSGKFHMSKNFFKSQEMGNYHFQDLSSTYDKYKGSFDPTSMSEFLDHESGKRYVHNKTWSSHSEVKNVKDNNVVNVKNTNVIGTNRNNHMNLNLSSKDNRLGISKGSDKRTPSNIIHSSTNNVGKKYTNSKNLQSFNNKLNFSSDGVDLGMSSKMNIFNNAGEVGGSALGGSSGGGNNLSAYHMANHHLGSNHLGSNNVGSNNIGSNNIGNGNMGNSNLVSNNVGSYNLPSNVSSSNLGSSNSVSNVLKDESHLLGSRTYNNMLSSSNMNPLLNGENNNLLSSSYANVTNVLSSSNGMVSSGNKVYNSGGGGEGNLNDNINNVGSLNGTSFQTNKSNSSVNNRINSSKNHMGDILSGQNYVNNVLLYDSGGVMYNGKVGSMNSYARQNLPHFSGQTLENYPNQSVDNYASQSVDHYANPNIDNYANQSVDPYANPNIDNYLNPNIDNYGSPHLDNYGTPVMDSYVNPIMDSYANAALDNYANQSVDNYANQSVDNYANPSVDNYVSPNADNYVNPSGDNYANPNVDSYVNPDVDNYPNQSMDNYGNQSMDNYTNQNVDNYASPHMENYTSPHMDNFVNPLMDSYMNPNMESFANQSLDNYGGQNIGNFASPNVDNFASPPSVDNFASPNPPQNVETFVGPSGESYPHGYLNNLPMNYLNGGMTSALSNNRGTSSINNMNQYSNELTNTSSNMLNSIVGKKNNLLLSGMNNTVSSSKGNFGMNYINDTFKKASNLFLKTVMRRGTRNASGNKIKRNKNKELLESKGGKYEMTSPSKEGNGSGMVPDRGGVNYVLEDPPPGIAKYIHSGEMAERIKENDAASALTTAIATAIATSTSGAGTSVQHMKCLEEHDTIKKKVKKEKRTQVKNIKINIDKINLLENKKKKYLAEIIRCELIWGPTKNKEPITPVESCELHPVVIIKDQYGHLYDDDEDNENNPIGKTVNIFYRWSRGPPRTVCFFHPQKIACLQCTVTFRCFCSYECFMKGFDHVHKYYRSNGLINIPSHPNLHTYGVPCSPFDWENYEKNIEFDEKHYNSLMQSGLLNSPDMEKWEIINNERNYIPCLKDVGHQIMLETMLLDKNTMSSENGTTSSDECEGSSVDEDSSEHGSQAGEEGTVGAVGAVDELHKGDVREGSDCNLSSSDEKNPGKKKSPAECARYADVQTSELDTMNPDQVGSLNEMQYAGNHKEEDPYSGQLADGSGIANGDADTPNQNDAGTNTVFTSKGDSSTEANAKQPLPIDGTLNENNNVSSSPGEEGKELSKEEYTTKSALNHGTNEESEGNEKRMDTFGVNGMDNGGINDTFVRNDEAMCVQNEGEPTSGLIPPIAEAKEEGAELKEKDVAAPANGDSGENVEDRQTNQGARSGIPTSPSESATAEVESKDATEKLTHEGEKNQIEPTQENALQLKKKKKRKKKKIYILDDQVWNNIRDPNIYHKIITGCCIPNVTISPNYNVTCFKNSTVSNVNNQFTIMTWNVLAEIYGTIEAFPHCDPYMLAWSYRKTKIIQEILNNSPDIICLQEIQNEHFLDFFKPSLGELGYEGVYKQKTKEIFTSPSGKRRGGKYTIDGCAIFYNKKKLKFVETYALEFSKLIKEASVFTLPKEVQKNPSLVKRLLKDNVALVILLEYIQQYSKMYDSKEEGVEKPNKNLIIVANTHIVANPEANYVKIWQAQILVKVVEYLRINFIKKYETIPSLIICGDFNSTPSSAVYQLIYKKTCSRSHEDFSSDKYSLLTDLPLGHNLNLKSAYAISKLLSQKLNPEEYSSKMEIFEPLFTNYTGNFIGCLDYIFYNDENLNIISTVNIADENQLMQEAHIYQLSNCALPSPIRPSDHLPLIAKFEFKIY
ncbi:putative Carbon catabolite repressor protein 4 [Plasmodium knowlesi]|uniref:Putative Carbon catabolite repressor protein 4 n=1 Tax=Plasmodium knowlesi TaxID=5850 RepID=A0A1Y3DVH3_PLAKN|nr:putative Carbon catabolite repressor protein 4 [Plasmodium knowlesi]